MSDRLEKMKAMLSEFVSERPFNNVAVVINFLNYLDELRKVNPSIHALEAFEHWIPDSSEYFFEKGSNCIGMSDLFSRRVLDEIEGEEVSVEFRPAYTERLPNGLETRNHLQFTHLALVLHYPDNSYFLDPGLGLVHVFQTEDDSVIEINGVNYQLRMYGEVLLLNISKPHSTSSRGVEFIFEKSAVGFNPELDIQKPLLRATSSVKIDAMNSQGQKDASLKIDLLRGQISLMYRDATTLSFSTSGFSIKNIEDLFASSEYKLVVQDLGLPLELVSQEIQRVVSNRQTMIDVWFPELAKEYYLHNGHLLSPFESSWSELEKMGYKGGGVVLVLMNKDGHVLLYRVPEGKEKPFIGRRVGHMNLFVETADPDPNADQGVTGVSALEPFQQNLERALEEELGIGLAELGEFKYYETDYRPNIRARMVVSEVPDYVLAAVNRHIWQNAEKALAEGKIVEMGPAEWVDISSLSESESDNLFLEPQARILLQRLIKEEE